MHAIWSAARQAHGHPRRACLQTTNVLIRRSASVRPRRRLAMRDAFTACYTTIMATAAVLDAKYKDRRRLELDRKVAEAKDGLSRLMEQSVALELAQAPNIRYLSSYRPEARPLKPLEALYSICVSRGLLQRGSKAVTQRRFRRKYLEQGLGLRKRRTQQPGPAAMLSNGPPVVESRMAEMEDLLANEECDPGIREREPLSDVHLSKMTKMIETLVDHILLEAHRDETGAISPEINSLDSAWHAIRMLRSDGYPSYSDPNLDPDATAEARRDLNAANMRIMADLGALQTNTPMAYLKYKTKRIHLVGKICYNLLVSPVPPGIHNYNALMFGFLRIGERSLAEKVVHSFLFQSHLRATQMTFACLLHHYRLKRDVPKFYGILCRLIGVDPLGIGLRRRTLEEVAAFKSSQRWARSHDVAPRYKYIIQRADFDDNLIRALMDGLIDFKQTIHSAKIFVACLSEGLSISAEYIRQVVELCVSHLDRRAAYILAHGFLRNINAVVSYILDDSLDEPQSLPYAMLDLLDLLDLGCARRRSASASRGAAASYDGRMQLSRLKRALWMRITLYELQETAKCASQVEQILYPQAAQATESAPDAKLAATAASQRSFFKTVANLEWINHLFSTQLKMSKWLMFNALPPQERRKLRVRGRRVLKLGDIPAKAIVRHWRKYLRGRSAGAPAEVEGRIQ